MCFGIQQQSMKRGDSFWAIEGKLTWIAEFIENSIHFYLPIKWHSLKTVTGRDINSWWDLFCDSETRVRLGDGRWKRLGAASSAWLWFPPWEAGGCHRSAFPGKVAWIRFSTFLTHTVSLDRGIAYHLHFQMNTFRSTSKGFKTLRPMMRET